MTDSPGNEGHQYGPTSAPQAGEQPPVPWASYNHPPMPAPDPSAGAPNLRPTTVTTAAALLIAAAVAWILISSHVAGLRAVARPSAPPATSNTTDDVTAIFHVLYIVFAVRAARGRQRARTAVSVETVLLFLLMVPYVWLGLNGAIDPFGATYAVMDIVVLVASCVGVVLLHLPQSNAFFRWAAAARTK